MPMLQTDSLSLFLQHTVAPLFRLHTQKRQRQGLKNLSPYVKQIRWSMSLYLRFFLTFLNLFFQPVFFLLPSVSHVGIEYNWTAGNIKKENLKNSGHALQNS